eukprot:6606193-Lingulodinium_polyedra.AAC.1
MRKALQQLGCGPAKGRARGQHDLEQVAGRLPQRAVVPHPGAWPVTSEAYSFACLKTFLGAVASV